MAHRNKITVQYQDSETSSEDEEITETGSTVSVRKQKFLGIPVDKLSYKKLPRKCLKVSFLAINCIKLLAGIITVVLSTWMLVDIKLLIGQSLFISIFLLVGMFVTMVSFMGLLAFMKRRKNILTIYIICQSISLYIIFISAIMSFSFFETLMQKIRIDMTNSLENYHNLDWATEAWDNTQRYLKCCGIKSYKDWIENRKSIPLSCCSTTIEKCVEMSESVAYKSGCFKTAVILLKSHIHSISISILLISIIIAASLIVAFGVRRKLKVF